MAVCCAGDVMILSAARHSVPTAEMRCDGGTVYDGIRWDAIGAAQANREDEEHERKAANRRCDYSVVATLRP